MNLTSSFRYQTKKILALAGLLVASVLMIGLANLALASSQEPKLQADERIVNIYDQGEERVIITKSRTVRQALKAADIDVSEPGDVVEPSLDTDLSSTKFNINIYRAKTVTVVDGADLAKKRVTTAQQTPEGIAKEAKLELHKEDRVRVELSSDLLMDGVDTVMIIDRATPVNLTLFGKSAEIRTRASTVDGLLKEKGIAIGQNDTLSVDRSTSIVAGMAIEIWRNGKQTVTVEEEVDFPVERIQDGNREIGYREVKTPGEKGKRNATYEVEMKNGQELSRKEIASVMTKEPKKQVEVVGAKPPTPTNPSENAKLGHQMMLAAGYGEEQWSCLYNLWSRESGWRTTAGNPSSGAYGIPQALPASKMSSFGSDYMTNPATQIAWGLSYIKGRYSTPCGAWGFFLSHNWY